MDGGSLTAERQKHHYLPVFYLKQWAGEDGRLCEFSRPYKTVKPRRTHPDGTAYVRGLYTFQGLSPLLANFLEQQFLLRADDGASAVLKLLLLEKLDFGADEKSAWSRFLMTLLHRSPESVERITRRVETELPAEIDGFRDKYEALRKERGGGPTFEEFKRSLTATDVRQLGLTTVHKLMDSENLGNKLNGMVWSVITLQEAQFLLLTSDRPFIMTNGIGKPDARLLLPISPKQVFVATNNMETMKRLFFPCPGR